MEENNNALNTNNNSGGIPPLGGTPNPIVKPTVSAPAASESAPSAPVENVPVASASVADVSVTSEPVPSAPAGNVTAESVPVSSTPAESTPVSNMPVENTPAVADPTESNPVVAAPVAPVSPLPEASVSIPEAPSANKVASEVNIPTEQANETPAENVPKKTSKGLIVGLTLGLMVLIGAGIALVVLNPFGGNGGSGGSSSGAAAGSTGDNTGLEEEVDDASRDLVEFEEEVIDRTVNVSDDLKEEYKQAQIIMRSTNADTDIDGLTKNIKARLTEIAFQFEAGNLSIVIDLMDGLEKKVEQYEKLGGGELDTNEIREMISNYRLLDEYMESDPEMAETIKTLLKSSTGSLLEDGE